MYVWSMCKRDSVSVCPLVRARALEMSQGFLIIIKHASERASERVNNRLLALEWEWMEMEMETGIRMDMGMGMGMSRYGSSLAWHNHLAACSAAFKINSTQVRFGRPENTWHTWNANGGNGAAGSAITVSIFASETNCTLIAHVQLKANAKQRRNEDSSYRTFGHTVRVPRARQRACV